LWTPEYRTAFKNLKAALISAPVLGLPDLSKPFEQFVHEQHHLALGVLTQKLGTWKQAIGFFFKPLDNVSKRWPGCLPPVASTVLFIQEAKKLTMGQKDMVYVPHTVICLGEKRALAVPELHAQMPGRPLGTRQCGI